MVRENLIENASWKIKFSIRNFKFSTQNQPTTNRYIY